MKKAIITVSIIVGVLAAVYIAGVVLAHNYFMPHTFVNGEEVSYMDSEQARELLLSDNKIFTITELGGLEESIELSDIKYSTELSTTTTMLIRRQNQFSWPASFFSNHDIDDPIAISYNETALETRIAALDALKPENVTEPADAFIDCDESGQYFLVPEIEGNQLDIGRTSDVIKDALDNGEYAVDLVRAECYLKPEVTAGDEELNDLISRIYDLNEEVITVDLTGAEYKIDTLKLIEFCGRGEEGEIQISWDGLDEIVDELADKYETYMKKRDFVTHDKKTIKVGGAQQEEIALDTYGFLMDKVQTFNAIYFAIKGGESKTVSAAWTVPALTRDEKNLDIGNTYVEVSLDAQHFWYYEDGKLKLESDVVTGLDSDPERQTPPGVYRIWDKKRNETLSGRMADDEWNSHVDYWLSVTWTGIGFHDASWRSVYGGDIYKTDGSHGCINVPRDNMIKLYSMIKVDTPVVVY